MRALAFTEFGGPETLAVRDVPDPVVGPGDILVRVRACALNHADLLVREGRLPALRTPLPFWTGCDVAGEVAAVGPGAEGVRVGERVVVNPVLACGRCEFCAQGEDCLCPRVGVLGEHVHGGLAELVRVPADRVLALPAHVTDEDAAAFVVTHLTAWRMVVTQARVRPGEDVLITGIGGGVSIAALGIARLCGARVLVTSSSDDKLERARRLGADVGVNYAREDWATAVWRETGKRGVDVVLDSVGAATWAGALRSLRRGGRLVTCGATTGTVAETDLRVVFWRQVHVIGSTMGNRREFLDVMRLLFQGRLRPVVDRVLPLADGAEAQRLLAAGRQFGKLVLRVSEA